MREKRADERTRTADLLITSLLRYVLSCSSASAYSIDLQEFYSNYGSGLSAAYRSVLARLQYGFSKLPS
jgi:hypothetical protein